MDLRPRTARRRGFTLVEMLAVVVIIGILAGLITAAAVQVIGTARNTRILSEIGQLDLAIKAYKEKFGDYPPDFTDADAVRRHLARAFPLCPPGNYPNFANQNPSTALTFWLGGLPTGSGGVLNGFSANPRNPFDLSPSRIGPFFDFDPNRLYDIGGALQYYPAGVPLGSSTQGYGPYVYFRARYNPATRTYGYEGHPGWPAVGVRPMRDTRRTGNQNPWVNPETFQIRAAGLDGKFGRGVMFPTGEDYDEDQLDDLGNFADGVFEDQMQQ